MPLLHDNGSLYILTRCLAFPSCGGASARLISPSGADTIVYALYRIRRRVPALLVGGGGVTLFFPLFAKKGVWALSSAHNRPSLLRAFWRAVVELLFDVWLDKEAVGSSGLVFQSGAHEFEVTDEWGPEWYIVVRPVGVGDALRSRSSTPERVGDSWDD